MTEAEFGNQENWYGSAIPDEAVADLEWRLG